MNQIGFIETANFTATYINRHRDKLVNGVLKLRDFDGDSETVVDLPLVKDWKTAKSLLSRLRAGAAPHFGGVTPGLGRAWIEVLPPQAGTPWTAEAGDYADTHIRTRTCLIPSPGAVSHVGLQNATLLVGVVTSYDPRALACEVNHGEHARAHLIVDVRRPE